VRYKRSARRHGWETRAADDHLAMSDQPSIEKMIDCTRETDTELRAEGF
jgi:hypothetical protein